ncbi:DUF6377 domain-containing protein [Mucilaginibacter gynuensis]|uniref:DUF6377 domain-containing protein n=1 Tax=Mucilaginibacter gynuensis TaxID=1302236 RepID=A0ABP8GET9_9SPHI
MKILYTLLLWLLAVTVVYGQQNNDALMSQLKGMLVQRRVYDDRKEADIAGLKKALKHCSPNELEKQYQLCSSLFEEYRSYQYDSAYVYTQKMIGLSIAMHDLPKQYDSKIKLGIILISSGMFKETLDCINQVNPKVLDKGSKLRYYRLQCVYYADLAYYNNDKYYTKQYVEQANKYLDTAISLTENNSFEQIMYKAEIPDTAGQKISNYKYYEYLLYQRKLTPHQTAMIAAALSDHYQGAERMKLLLIAAINDIKSSTKETMAVYKIGTNLYKSGDIKNAYLFMQEALSNAQFYGSRLHKIEIASVLPDIAANKILISENEKNKFIIYLLSSLIIVVIISLISFIVFIQLKRLRVKERIIEEKNNQLEKINKRLSEEARIKEEYIGYFFNVFSEYILKLEKLKRNAERKMKSKKYDEVLALLSQIDIKQERDHLFRTFDRVFLKLFPNFITSFNALLKPEDQIWPKGNEVLSAHLRIFALVRLGINDNETIAKILEYTVSTIYTYKVRVKAKAIVPHDEFTNHIMDIQVVDTGKP